MRRSGGALAASLLVGLLAAAPAYANHDTVQSIVSVQHDGATVSMYSASGPSSNCVESSGTLFCGLNVFLNNRDYGRFIRWCGETNKAVSFSATDTSKFTTCQGPSTWSMLVIGTLFDCDNTGCNATAHGSPVILNAFANKI